jgi:hypothetical protein
VDQGAQPREAEHRLQTLSAAIAGEVAIVIDALERAPEYQARVLAGESDEEIAYKVGTDPEIINAYINVFFDVRGKMNHTDYMVNVVMADAVTRGLQERHYDLLWKLLGYHGGTHVLNAVINKFTHTDRPDNPQGVSNFFQDFAVNAIKYKAAIAALTVQANTHTQLPLIDSYVKYIEIERSTQVVVDTVRDALDEKLGPLLPLLEVLAKERGIDITELALPR